VIGLEVHAQVTTNAKLFSGAAAALAAEPNTQVSLVDAAMPGMLPVPNRECIRQAVRTGMAIDAQINKWSVLTARIISTPICRRATRFRSSIIRSWARARWRSMLDEKAGSPRAQDHRHRTHPCRAGCGQADARSAPDHVLCRSQPLGRGADGNRVAAGYAFACRSRGVCEKLRQILRYVGSCDGNMDQGSMRADVNVRCASPAKNLARARRPRTSIRCAS
jgi:aspartyl-tRNA(Asn)/glutamyl-tRNA(Gln) amidotransferase subunit B